MALTDDVICSKSTTRRHLHLRALTLRPGRPGVEPIVRITKPDAEGEFWSWLERRFSTAVVDTFDLPPPEYNVPIRDEHGLVGYADVLWRAQEVVVELQGLRFHRTSAQRQRDSRKLNRYTIARLRPLQFSYEDVVKRPGQVAEQLVAALGNDQGNHWKSSK